MHYQLKDANVAWPTKLANTGLAWITESGARKQATNQASPDTKHLIGTGPFVFESAVNSDYTVVKNPNYYGTDAANGGAKLPYLDKIEFTPLADTADPSAGRAVQRCADHADHGHVQPGERQEGLEPHRPTHLRVQLDDPGAPARLASPSGSPRSRVRA